MADAVTVIADAHGARVEADREGFAFAARAAHGVCGVAHWVMIRRRAEPGAGVGVSVAVGVLVGVGVGVGVGVFVGVWVGVGVGAVEGETSIIATSQFVASPPHAKAPGSKEVAFRCLSPPAMHDPNVVPTVD